MDLTFILNRLKEKSTWVAIGSALTATGIQISPEHWQLVMGIGMGLPSIIAIFLPARVMEKNVVPTTDKTDLSTSLEKKAS